MWSNNRDKYHRYHSKYVKETQRQTNIWEIWHIQVETHTQEYAHRNKICILLIKELSHHFSFTFLFSFKSVFNRNEITLLPLFLSPSFSQMLSLKLLSCLPYSKLTASFLWLYLSMLSTENLTTQGLNKGP